MDHIQRVRRAAAAKRRAERAYVDAIIAAHEAGFAYSEIAEAADVSRQAARQLVIAKKGASS
jgi:hypothetical protein